MYSPMAVLQYAHNERHAARVANSKPPRFTGSRNCDPGQMIHMTRLHRCSSHTSHSMRHVCVSFTSLISLKPLEEGDGREVSRNGSIRGTRQRNSPKTDMTSFVLVQRPGRRNWPFAVAVTEIYTPSALTRRSYYPCPSHQQRILCSQPTFILLPFC